jgi:hypothetical protein
MIKNKILYITSEQSFGDFLSDSILHGLKTNKNNIVYDIPKINYMYTTYNKSSLVNTMHGRGFSYPCTIDDINIDRNNILDKIQNNYFDYIIYGNVYRSLTYLEDVIKYYPKNKIILIDGEDHSLIKIDLLNFGTYYKRELTENDSKIYPDIKPISFSYPKEKFISSSINKEKILATVIPGIMDTFIFNNENDYYGDYRKSMFAYTWKKSGYDCLRHYEILCNGCIPLMLDIEFLPETNCKTIPKELLINFYKKTKLYELFEMDRPPIYDDRNTLIINKNLNLINDINVNKDFNKIYIEYIEKIYEYAINNLTTIKISEYILSEKL